MLTASALALRDLLEGDDAEPAEEIAPQLDTTGEPWVSYLHVPGSPRASRILVRPWRAPQVAQIAQATDVHPA